MKRTKLIFFSCCAFFLCSSGNLFAKQETEVKRVEDIYIRDPYILSVEKEQMYYMYRSASVTNEHGKTVGGVQVFKSKDLKNWTGPVQVCELPETNWSSGLIWAPEVHCYRGKYYLFATINSDIVWKKEQKGWPPYIWRGTQIFRSNSPEGPFVPFSGDRHTPADEMALDGTLWVEDGIPYMIYCHEWVQIADGSIKLVELSSDLSKPVGIPVMLFHASAAKWSTGSAHESPLPTSYVTDGCFLYRTKTGRLLMIWSSFMDGQYAVGIAESVSGKVIGPWKQQDEPVFRRDGGHAMIFKTFEGKLCIVLHQPNSGGKERAHIYELEDLGNTLRIKAELE